MMIGLRQNNKGQIAIGLIILIVIGFIAVAFFAIWTYGLRIINANILSVEVPTNITNISQAGQATFSQMVDGLNGLKIVAFILFISYALAILIIGYYARSHPIMLVVFFLIVIVMVIFSVYVSNTYELLLSDPTFGLMFEEYSVMKFFMRYLPYWVGAIGLIAAMFAVTGSIREQGGAL